MFQSRQRRIGIVQIAAATELFQLQRDIGRGIRTQVLQCAFERVCR